MDQEYARPPSLDYAPEPGQRNSSWPITFGIIAIVFGLFALVINAISIVTSTMMGNVYRTAATQGSSSGDTDEMISKIADHYEQWSSASLIIGVGLTLLAALLITAGILLLMRKPLGATLYTVWAYAKIVLGIGSSLVAYQLQSGQMQAMMASAGSAGSGPGMPASASSAINIFTGVFVFISILWLIALPITVLIWLNREPVKTDIASWRTTRSSDGA